MMCYSLDETVIKIEEAFNVPLKVDDVLSTAPAHTPTPQTTPVAVSSLSVNEILQTPEPSTTPSPTPSPSPEDIQRQIDAQLVKKLEGVQKLLDRGRETEAKKILADVSAQNPDSKIAPQALYLLGRLESNIPEAIKILKDLIARYPNTVWSGLSYYKLSEYYFFLGNYAETEANLAQYVNLKLDVQFREKALRNLSAAQVKLHKFEEAKSSIDQLWNEFSDTKSDPSILESYGEIMMDLNKYKDAVEIFSKVISNYPSYSFISRVYLSKGFCLESLNDNESAIEIYSEITTSFPQTIEADLANLRLSDLRKPIIPKIDDKSTTASLSIDTTNTLVINENIKIGDETTSGTKGQIQQPVEQYKSKDF